MIDEKIWPVRLIIICAIAILLPACARPEQPVPEAPVEAVAAPPEEPAPALSPPVEEIKLSPPETAEVMDKIKQVYQGVVIVDTSVNPSFIAGDFNGDLSQDLAVIVKPVEGRLEEINSSVANWMIRAPVSSSSSDRREQSQPAGLESPAIRVEASDRLLAVIHGYEAAGWRAPEATQTYLLKNTVGAGMKTRPLKSALNANRGKKMPHLRGDVIEQVLAGESGFLYYTGAEYGWYDRRNRQNVEEHKIAHGKM